MTPLILTIANAVRSAGGRALLVGGCVRDRLLGLEPKDYDLEVFGIAQSELENLLAGCGQVSHVGRAFPVWKVWTQVMGQGLAIDVSLPRKETKIGANHIDFEITLDPFMSFEAASLRRDYTMNAMGFDPLTGALLDPHFGQSDLQAGILRHVSLHFMEDPLRVLRGAQFCARFDLEPAEATIRLCRQLTPEHLSAERLWEEWQKLILKGRSPSRGIQFLIDTEWIKHFPELAALSGVPQNPDHHPEGSALVHTMHCLDAFADTRTGNDREDLIVGLAALCHDLGKATHTQIDPVTGKITAYGHEVAGEEPTRSFLGRLTNEPQLIEDVVALVVTHMRPTFLYKDATRGAVVKQMNRSVRRLAQEVNLERLARLVWIDKAGRPPKPRVSPEADWLRERASTLVVLKEGPKPLLMGRHLIELGLKPGGYFKNILAAALEQQLDGNIETVGEAIEFAKLITGLREPVSLLDDVHLYIATATPEQVAADLKASEFDKWNGIGEQIIPPPL